METEFSKLNISDENSNKDSNLENISQKNCSYCNKPFTKELWCKECDPFRMIEGWTSRNNDIDKFIKDIIYDARKSNGRFYDFKILEWVPFDRFEDLKQIGEGGFAKVYSATWIDGKVKYFKQDDGSWKKRESESIKVALKRLNGSQNMSAEYLNELKIHWKFTVLSDFLLKFYGITKDPETEEFLMILDVAQKGNLRSFLSSNFNKILWNHKIGHLYWIASNLDDLHGLGYFHKDFHSGNILQISDYKSYISDFGLSGPSNKQKSDDKICGVLPYIAPEE
ncbi:Dbf20p [Rhizophagus irregularis DAOM 197198w]|uniref:Dbf20p n=1 Tax=Rhizophagus irregularis (strain DAOM 197198w) TaxID=1432141 RepID=A0A015IIR4_RHIIW|nr:Dbf20p [Rhizophagus irregularis DAOM 197198w]